MDNADIGAPTGNVECPQTCSAFQNCGPSIRCNAPDRIKDGYFNGLLMGRRPTSHIRDGRNGRVGKASRLHIFEGPVNEAGEHAS